jgi:hypothetical protein
VLQQALLDTFRNWRDFVEETDAPQIVIVLGFTIGDGEVMSFTVYYHCIGCPMVGGDLKVHVFP